MEYAKITDVYQEKAGEDSVHLYFTYDYLEYQMHIRKIKNQYKPMWVFHMNDHPCILCEEEASFTRCVDFEERIVDLFHHLIERPSVRLEWIYLEHA